MEVRRSGQDQLVHDGTRARRGPLSRLAVAPLSYATVRDYCDSYDHLGPLATASRRPERPPAALLLKAILATVGARVAAS